MVESLRSAVAFLEKNEEMAQAALANTMGLPWTESIRPAVSEVPFTPYAGNLENLVAAAYQFSPDWAKLEAGIRAAQGAVQTAKSGHYPKIAVTGELHKWWNDYDAGMATDQNKEGWSIGIGMEIPIFDGFRTSARTEQAIVDHQRVVTIRQKAEEGLRLQVQSLELRMAEARKRIDGQVRSLSQAQKAVQIAQTRFKSGVGTQLELMDTQVAMTRTQTNYAQGIYDYLVARAEWENAVGQPR